MSNDTRTTETKLRRDRDFASGTSIQSKIPTAEDPRSRRVQSDERAGPHGGFLDVRERTDPLAEEEFVNQVICGDSASSLALSPGRSSCASSGLSCG